MCRIAVTSSDLSTYEGGRAMTYTDKVVTCRDCGQAFEFTADEQREFASVGRFHVPSRCASCREARKKRQEASGSARANLSRSGRRMHPATCADCGISTLVPFEPQSNRPVYCSECYKKHRPSHR